MKTKFKKLGKLFYNASGRHVQHPLRLTNEAAWSPGERVKVIGQRKNGHNEEPGYIVMNIDYMGIYTGLKTAWISKTHFKSIFEEII